MDKKVSRYAYLLGKLREDIKKLNLKKHKLKDFQLSMLDFIEGKSNSSQYVHHGIIIQLTRGNEKYGFEHILRNHYEENSNGKLTPREILNIWMLLINGSNTTDYEDKRENKSAYRLIKQNGNISIRLKIVYYEDKLICKVLTYYSDRVQEVGDLS